MENNYKEVARESRLKCLDLIYKAQTSHIGSVFGCADIMAVLFGKINLDVDKFILSKGWVASILYFHLWRKGRITKEELDSYCQDGSKWIGLAEPIHKDIIFAGGSMGMGISAAVALAWSKKQRSQDGTVYVLESDGGMQVGINAEAMRFASHHKLNNLCLIVEKNDFQAMGKTDDILKQDLREECKAFGWAVLEIDGHNYNDLEFAFAQSSEKPLAIIAQTTKGKGVLFMENENVFHYKAPNEAEYLQAQQELNG